ncbi:MAG: alpha/beta fold hydrolase [Paracoccaceae bacterium]
MTLQYLTTPQGRRLAYHLTEGDGPPVVFLHGFKSSMDGSKAIALEVWAKRTGRAFLRFDLSGHGASDGLFTDGTIGAWLEDARAAVDLVEGPAVLVGSSMGGWLSLLLARERPEAVAGLVGIAASPDFTTRMWDDAPQALQAYLMTAGRIELPSGYAEPYVITRALIEDGRGHSIFERPLSLPFPVRLLQGSADEAVPQSIPLRIMEHAACADMRVTLVKGANHSFSSPDALDEIVRAIAEVSTPRPD